MCVWVRDDSGALEPPLRGVPCAEELQALAKNSVDTSSLASAAVSTSSDPGTAAFFRTMAGGGGGGAGAAAAAVPVTVMAVTAAVTAAAKPRCTYWDKCYRKNADHLRDFEHPTDVDHTGVTPHGERAFAA